MTWQLTETPPSPLRDEEAFYSAIRPLFGGSLTTSQVEGIKAILAGAAKARWGAGWTANALGTAFLETNHSMQPVAEAYFLGDRAEAWRRAHLRYYPWYGRGYPQVTWEVNYQKADDYLASLGLIQPGDLMKNPDLMLRADLAGPVMIKFMEEGWFTGKKLADFIPGGGLGTPEGHKDARRIINGKDRWEDLSHYAMVFQPALVAGGWRP